MMYGLCEATSTNAECAHMKNLGTTEIVSVRKYFLYTVRISLF